MYYFIINPNSSSGKGLLIWKSIEPVLKERNVDYHPFFTKDRESTAHLVKRLCTEKAPATIVAVGGDGTVNDVLNGLSNFENITFGYIPSGSGNDLARGLHLETDPEKALERILSPTRTESLRIGSVSAPAFSRRFLVSSGLGFDAAVCEGALHSRFKKFLNQLHLGKLTYTGIALKELFLSHCPKAKLILDKATVVEVPAMFFTAAMNLPYEGGGFQFCPKADPKDDRLDLILVEKMPKLKILVPPSHSLLRKAHPFPRRPHLYLQGGNTYHRTSSFPTYGRRNPRENHGSDLAAAAGKAFHDFRIVIFPQQKIRLCKLDCTV